MIKNKNISDAIEKLKVKYRKDGDALAEIERATESIKYYEKNGENEKAMHELRQLEAFLHDWY